VSAEDLIQELTRDLEPVRPIPPLRNVVAGVVGLWLVVACAGVWILGMRPDLAEATIADLGVTAVFVSLMGAGLLGVIAALALSVPGREQLARVGLLGGLGALAIAGGLGTLLFARSPVAEVPAAMGSDLVCLGIACAVGLLPGLGVVWFAGRSAPYQPLVLVLAAAAGTAALGAVSAHASCPYADLRHMLVGHVLAPAAGALLLTVPLLIALKRVERS